LRQNQLFARTLLAYGQSTRCLGGRGAGLASHCFSHDFLLAVLFLDPLALLLLMLLGRLLLPLLLFLQLLLYLLRREFLLATLFFRRAMGS